MQPQQSELRISSSDNRQFLLCKQHQVGQSSPQHGITDAPGMAQHLCGQSAPPAARPSVVALAGGATATGKHSPAATWGCFKGYHEALILLEMASSWVDVELLRQDPEPPKVPVAYMKQIIKLVIIQAAPALGVSGHVEDSQKEKKKIHADIAVQNENVKYELSNWFPWSLNTHI